MKPERIDLYCDPRFSQTALNQHGCFLAAGAPYEVEIISEREAVVRGRDADVFPEIIEEFRFYSPNITIFYDQNHNIILELPPLPLLTIPLSGIQPSQFYVDEEKLAAIQNFIEAGEDIVIPVCQWQDRYVSLDGHTRLYYAVTKGWKQVRAVEEEPDHVIFDFVKEAQARNIFTPQDMELLNHEAYQEKWIKFCDNYFAEKQEKVYECP